MGRSVPCCLVAHCASLQPRLGFMLNTHEIIACIGTFFYIDSSIRLELRIANQEWHREHGKANSLEMIAQAYATSTDPLGVLPVTGGLYLVSCWVVS